MSFGIFQFRRGTFAQWQAANPVLADGELGLETNTRQIKIGDGVTAWNALPYGGIKGDMGATGAQGVQGFDGWEPVLSVVPDGERRVLQLTDWTGGGGTKPTAFVGQYIGSTGYTSNIAQATDIRGATGLTGATGATGNTGATGAAGTNGWSPILAVVSDGERRVLQVTDWTGGTGTKPATGSFIGPTGFVATAAQAVDIRGATGATGPAGSNGVTSFNGRTGAITPQQGDYDAFFTTPAEAAAAAPVQSVNGQTGNVTVAAGTNNAATTRSSATASASTAVTTLVSHAIAAGEIVPGSEYEFTASLRVINTTTATNSVVTLSVGATNVLVLTQANGGTAAAAPGAPVYVYGKITFYSDTQAEAIIHFARSQAVAANIILNTSAPITVSAAGATTIDLKFNTSGATGTFICRQATIQRVK